jgi:hypothetical protein
MARTEKVVSIRVPAGVESSPLTPELKQFIDQAVVPALVRRYFEKPTDAKADNRKENGG